MIEKLKNLRKSFMKHFVYDGMICCLYCKHWGVINWCNLKNKRTYSSSCCEQWEILE